MVAGLLGCLLAAFAPIGEAAGAGLLGDPIAGISLQPPVGWAGWLGSSRSDGLTLERLAVANFSARIAPDLPLCRAAAAYRRVSPSDGALLWVLERRLASRAHLRSLPRRPTQVRLRSREAGGCFEGFYRWRFRTGGRALTLAALVGRQASQRARRELKEAIITLEVASSVVGRSTQGRAIRLFGAGESRALPRILIVGCIHGDECAASSVISRLRSKPVNGSDLWLLPTLNPDGLAAGTRQSAAGVDLNRNFPGTWAAGSAPGQKYYAGPRAASEPETRVGMAVIERLRPNVTIWFHQPEINVRAGGGSARAARAYASLVGLPYLPLPVPPGAATAWQTSTFERSQAFVVELPPGPLSRADAARHAQAVRALPKLLRQAQARR